MHRARGTKNFEFLRWPFEIPTKQCRPTGPHWADWPAVVSLKLRRPSWKFKNSFSPGFLLSNLMFWMSEWRGRIFLSFKNEVAKSRWVPEPTVQKLMGSQEPMEPMPTESLRIEGMTTYFICPWTSLLKSHMLMNNAFKFLLSIYHQLHIIANM